MDANGIDTVSSERANDGLFRAVVLAAGQSRRAGGNKLLWPFGGERVIDAVLRAAEICCAAVRVVAGAYFDDLERHIRAVHPGVELIRNENWQAGGMFSSARLGLSDLPGPVFLHPGDIPGAGAAVYRAMIAAFYEHPRCEVLKPAYLGRAGHPILLGPAAVRAVHAAPAQFTLREALAPLATFRKEVDEPLILCDIDTPEQYRALVSMRSRSLPESPRTC